MKLVQALLINISLLFLALPCRAETPPQDPEQYRNWAVGIWSAMEKKQGTIELPNGVATLRVPEQFFYLSPADTRRVLEDLWGNPHGAETLGMLMPAGSNPFDDNSWAVTIAFDDDGYVSDEDAADINYTDLLADMQSDTKAANAERKKAGYPPIALIGWAAPPHYDKASHKLYWAKELQFGDDPGHTLNYNIRMLGRKGVLVLNFIAGMSQKPIIEANLDKVMAIADFNQGHRYDEFNPSVDKVAAYGIGGLIAGKVLAKAGLFAGALLFLKKFAVLGLAALVGLYKVIFKRKEA